MKLFIAVIFIFIVMGNAAAGTDTLCVSDCLKLNNPKPFCVSECSYKDNAEQPRASPRMQAPNALQSSSPSKAPPSGSQCMKTCEQEGSTLPFCQRLCAKLPPDKAGGPDEPSLDD